MIKSPLIVILLWLAGTSVPAQQFNPLVRSNFDGLKTISLNPSAGVDSKIYLDINILSGSSVLVNNYFFIPREDLSWKNYTNGLDNIPRYGDHPLFEKGLPMNFYQDVTRPGMFGQAELMGPSIQVSTKRESFGFYTMLKAALFGTVPQDFLRFLLEGTSYKKLYNEGTLLDPIDFSMMAWGEIGWQYARVLNPWSQHNWYFGATFKLLNGYQGLFIHSDAIHYSLDDQSLLMLRDLHMTYGYTEDFNLFRPVGTGVGLDLGLSYIRRYRTKSTDVYFSLQEQSYRDYHWKAGISLIGLGSIRFRRTTSLIDLETNRPVTIEELNHIEFTSLDSTNELLIGSVYGEFVDQMIQNRMTMATPVSLSAQFDYHVWRALYINATVITPAPMINRYIKPPTVVSLCPRYEASKMGIWLPISWHSYSGLRLGLAALSSPSAHGLSSLCSREGVRFAHGLSSLCSRG